MSKKVLYIIGAILTLLCALVFLMWAIQTAWLGSFPGRDVEAYTRWAYMQFGASAFFFILAIVAFMKAFRSSRGKGQGSER